MSHRTARGLAVAWIIIACLLVIPLGLAVDAQANDPALWLKVCVGVILATAIPATWWLIWDLARDARRRPQISARAAEAWTAGFVFAFPVAVPLYWFRHLRHESRTVQS